MTPLSDRAAPVASLPMYDWPEVQDANDALWQAISARLDAAGIAAPAGLTRAREIDSVWHDSGLVLSQICGLPFSTRMRGLVRLVGTPVYEVPGCQGPYYSSMIVVRKAEAAEQFAEVKGRRFAYNNLDSLSGFVAFRVASNEAGIDPDFVDWIETGSHRASVRAVAGKTADVAAIDALCWDFALRFETEAASLLKVVATTPLRPAPPMITAVERREGEVQTIRTAIKAALADPATHAARETLRITGLAALDEFDYGSVASLGRQSG